MVSSTGAGYGTYTSVDFALLMDVLKNKQDLHFCGLCSPHGCVEEQTRPWQFGIRYVSFSAYYVCMFV